MSGGDWLLVTRSRLVKDFTNPGVRPGGVIRLHASRTDAQCTDDLR